MVSPVISDQDSALSGADHDNGASLVPTPHTGEHSVMPHLVWGNSHSVEGTRHDTNKKTGIAIAWEYSL